MKRKPIDIAAAIEFLTYDPMTGDLRWKKAPHAKIRIGSKAGTVNPKGYLVVMLQRSHFAAQNIIWCMVTGEQIPDGKIVDHEDRNEGNNAWLNLRLATRQQNAANATVRSRDLPKGVYTHVKGGIIKGYRASIGSGVAGKSRHLGLFATAAEAGEAYKAAARATYGEFANF